MNKIIVFFLLTFLNFLFINNNFIKAKENDHIIARNIKLPIVTLSPTPEPTIEPRPTIGAKSTLTPTPQVTIGEPVCKDGQRECVSNSQPRVCKNGYWMLLDPCGYNEECLSGKCVSRTDPSPTRRSLPTKSESSPTRASFSCYQCETQEQGDADCDTYTELDDFAAWLEVYKGAGGDETTVDFDCSQDLGQHIIDQADFRKWLDYFLLGL
jgi:hypothetical protein